MAAISKVTANCQATIPRDVREFLGVRRGDAVECPIEFGEVKVKRATASAPAYLNAVQNTLTDWDSEADDEAFSDL